MASKRFGRLKQWASEAISSNKSVVTEEAKEIDQDIDIRREGIRRLYDTAALFHHNISKKKRVDALEGEEKLLPREALGAVMIVHGEQFEEAAPYGAALINFGQAHCKIATLQEALAVTIDSVYLSSLSSSAEEIKEYDAERKQLETRRVNYDAALTTFEKVEANKKAKDKDRRDAEEELQKAKAKYDEAAEDLRARVASIQDSETDRLRDLTGLLDAELRFAEQYAEILRDAKASWPVHLDSPTRRRVGPMHTFSRSIDVSAANHAHSKSTASRPSKPASRPASVASRPKSSVGHSSRHQSESESSESESESSQEDAPISSRSRANSVRSKKSNPPSRPASRTGRDRRGSTATLGSKSIDEKSEKSGKKSGSIAGWASSWGRKKERETFASLEDSEHESAPSSQPSSSLNLSVLSFRSKSSNSPALPARTLNNSSNGQTADRKVVRALHDFTGSSDELSFRAGDRIVVVSEVLDDWWMGELSGKQGLFPTTYTEMVPAAPSPSPLRPRPPLPPRTASSEATQRDAEKEAGLNDDHPFGDHLAARDPYGMHSPMASTFSNDADSIADSLMEEKALMPKSNGDDGLDNFGPPGVAATQIQAAGRPLPPRRDTMPRKAPPPPPPRRSNFSTPSIPLATLETAPAIHHSLSDQATPVRSPIGLPDSETGDCVNFTQNPFKARGMCANCFRMHMTVN